MGYLLANKSKRRDLKRTGCVFIVKQLNLKQRDKLEWGFEIHNNEMVVIVRKK